MCVQVVRHEGPATPTSVPTAKPPSPSATATHSKEIKALGEAVVQLQQLVVQTQESLSDLHSRTSQSVSASVPVGGDHVLHSTAASTPVPSPLTAPLPTVYQAGEAQFTLMQPQQAFLPPPSQPQPLAPPPAIRSAAPLSGRWQFVPHAPSALSGTTSSRPASVYYY